MSTSQLVYSSVYTGYLDVDQGAKHLFFTFYESRRDPATGMWLFWMRDHLTLLDFLLDDTMMWINGGKYPFGPQVLAIHPKTRTWMLFLHGSVDGAR